MMANKDINRKAKEGIESYILKSGSKSGKLSARNVKRVAIYEKLKG